MFALGIRYLMGRAVSAQWNAREEAEWPPHPDRVFMALVAAHGETGEAADEVAALRWLEELPRPHLAVSLQAARRSSTTAYVPVNDTSNPVQKGKPLAPMGSLPIGRIRQPRQFPTVVPADPCVFLIWPDTETLPDHRTVLSRLCGKATYLGHSASPVQMWVEDAPPPPNLLPTDGRALHRLRVFGPGRLDDLRSHYLAGRRPLPSLWQGYAAPATTPPIQHDEANEFAPDLIVLRQVIPEDGHFHRFQLESTLMLSEALRDTLMRQRGRDIPEWLSGHQPGGSITRQPHLGILPLGFVGRQHADGHLLGLALAIPRTLREESCVELMKLLTLEDALGAPRTLNLTLGRAGQCHLELDERPAPARPQTLQTQTLTEPACRWATVTPIVLDRFPRRQLSAEEVVAEACVRAGLPRPAAVQVGYAPSMLGVPHSRSFPSLPQGGGRPPRPLTHAVLHFDQPVRGPVVIGAGRYVGYGLCRPYHYAYTGKGLGRTERPKSRLKEGRE